MSRSKAQINTFIGLGTNPKDYTPYHLKMIPKDQHCQLCGQHIYYSFLLEYKGEDRSKDLRVGSDCIITYVSAYMPNIMQAMIDKMEMEMASLVDEHKAKVFSETYPDFLKKAKELYDEIHLQIKKHNAFELRTGARCFPLLEKIKKADQDLRSKKYTTEPIAEEILSWNKKKELGELASLFDEHTKIKKDKLSLEAQIESEPENRDFFENHYKKYSVHLGWEKENANDSRALSKLEKYSFLEKEESYLRSMKIRKNKLIKNKASLDELKQRIEELFVSSPTTDPEKESLKTGWSSQKLSFDLDESFNVIVNMEAKKSIFKIVEKFGLSNLEKQFLSHRMLPTLIGNENLVDLDKSSYSVFYSYPEKIITKNKETADFITKSLRDDLIKRVTDIQEFLNSPELAAKCFN
jgi:hypothetical protein